MSQKTIAVVVGSIRKESFNRQFAEALVKQFPADLKAQFIRIDDLPLYNQDDDGNAAPQVARLREEIKAADGVLFVTAEYNRSVPGVLKNAIDHASRPWGQSVWAGKPAGVVGVAGGVASSTTGETSGLAAGIRLNTSATLPRQSISMVSLLCASKTRICASGLASLVSFTVRATSASEPAAMRRLPSKAMQLGGGLSIAFFRVFQEKAHYTRVKLTCQLNPGINSFFF